MTPLGRERPSPCRRLERIFSVYDLSAKIQTGYTEGVTGERCVNREEEARRKEMEMSEG